jgi:hypothetical protein
VTNPVLCSHQWERLNPADSAKLPEYRLYLWARCRKCGTVLQWLIANIIDRASVCEGGA